MMDEKVLPASYVICAYVRLSEEDDDVGGIKTESGSISAQRELIRRYIKNLPEFSKCTVIERCDDGYSGTHFDTRPGFTDMIELCKQGKINCIIVKDCSRFGRDYVELGDYLEQFFPFMGIRFISINDGYDSETCEGGLDIAFRNLIYDFYSRELSVKVKQTRIRMAKQGKYFGCQALYGYRKCKDDKHKLELEPESAAVVREIFDMRLAGMRAADIARNLNDRGIPCPTVFSWENGGASTRKDTGRKLFWDSGGVAQVLSNEMYTGCVISFQTGVESRGGRRVAKPVDEWIKVEGTHEAIVSKEEFEQVKGMMYKVTKPKTKRKPMHYCCGVCGRKLRNIGTKTIHCAMEYVSDRPGECDGVRIGWRDADAAVLSALKEKIRGVIEADKLKAKSRDSDGGSKDSVESLENAITALRKSKMALIDKLADRSISRETFAEKKKELDEQIGELEQRVSELRMKALATKEDEPNAGELGSFLDVNEMTEDMWEKFVRDVLVYPDKRMEIRWKFED